MKIVKLEDVIERLQYWSGGFDYVEVPTDYAVEQMENLPAFELVRCKDCKFREQDEVGRWFCRSLGCQIGNEDGSGFCADAERRTDE